MNKKILIYGGTFDPIHYGHIKPLESLSKRMDFSKVIYVPCHIPPHKGEPTLDAAFRKSSVEQALNSADFQCSVEVSDFELTNQAASYSVNTLRHYKATYPNADLYFAMGMDSLISFTKWYDWQAILELTNLIVFARPGYQLSREGLAPEIAQRIGKSIFLIENELIDVSSSEIRILLRKSIGEKLTRDERQKLELIPSFIIDAWHAKQEQ